MQTFTRDHIINITLPIADSGGDQTIVPKVVAAYLYCDIRSFNIDIEGANYNYNTIRDKAATSDSHVHRSFHRH